MTTVWKVLLGLALVVPMGAYVVGSLVASSSTPVSEQSAVVVPRAPDSPSVAPGTRFEQRSDPTPAPRDRADDGDDGADGTGDDAGGPTVDDNGVRIVTPEPRPVAPPAGGDDDDDDDGDGDGDDGDDGDDDGEDDDDGDDDGDD